MSVLFRRRIRAGVFWIGLACGGSACVSEFGFVEDPIVSAEERRTIDLDSASSEYIPVVKIPIVVDNSASMEDEQLLLAQNSSSLADAVQGKNVEFTILTSSALDSATSSEKSVHSSVTHYDWLGAVSDSLGRLTAPLLSDGPAYPAYMMSVENRLNPSLSGQPIVFRHDMTTAEFLRARSDLYDAIVGVGTGGSDNEAGLCAIGRTLAESSGPNRIFSSGDKAAFLIISDANDFSVSSQCSQTTRQQRYRFSSTPQAPVSQSVEDSSSPERWTYASSFKAPDVYRANYTYENGANYSVRAAYDEYRLIATYNAPAYHVVPHYQRPEFRVTATYQMPVYRASYAYQYPSTCPGRDSSTVPCTLTGSATNVAVADLGSMPASGACTGVVLAHVQSQLPPGGSLTSCSFSNTVSTSSATQLFDLAGYGNPASGNGSLACNASLVTLAQSLVPGGWTYSGCSYAYSANETSGAAQAFNPASHGNPASGNGNLACNASLVTLAQSLVPNGAVYSGCHYLYSANDGSTAPRTFNPADHGNPPAGNGSLACNASLVTLAQTLIPAGGTYTGCSYMATRLTRSQAFNPAQYGNPATGSGNLACNASLITLAQSLVPAGGVYGGCSYTGTTVITSASVNLASDHGLTNGANCAANAGVTTAIQAVISGKTIRSCGFVHTAGATVANCTMTDSENLSQNLCDGAPFVLGGVTYSGLDAYLRAHASACSGNIAISSIFRGCSSRKGYRTEITTPPNVEAYDVDGAPLKVSVIETLNAGLAQPGGNDFGSAINARATDLFGENGYFFSAIIAHANAGGCTPSPDSAGVGGQKYYDLAQTRPAGLRSLHPICDSTYEPALTGIGEFVERTTLTSYRVPLDEGERIISVAINRAGQILPLVAGSDYTVTGPSLDFAMGVVAPGDRLLVEATRTVFWQNGKQVPDPSTRAPRS